MGRTPIIPVEKKARIVMSVIAGEVSVAARWDVDEPCGLPGPAELLSAAFAACLMKNVERSSALTGFASDSADIDVTARRQESPPRFDEITYELRLATDEDVRHVNLLHRNLRQFGTVDNTLAAACDVRGTIVTSLRSVSTGPIDSRLAPLAR